MAEKFDALNTKHRAFIEAQHIYFVGTAGANGHVNVSPKGMDSLRIIDDTRVAWLNLTGSGNESAAHVLENGRMTVMFCSFDKQPLILRLYGQATVVHPRHGQWPALLSRFPDSPGARQIFVLNLSMVQTSCGYAVPFFEHGGERPTLKKWAINHGEPGLKDYWEQNNTHSLNGADTGIFTDVTDPAEPRR